MEVEVNGVRVRISLDEGDEPDMLVQCERHPEHSVELRAHHEPDELNARCCCGWVFSIPIDTTQDDWVGTTSAAMLMIAGNHIHEAPPVI